MADPLLELAQAQTGGGLQKIITPHDPYAQLSAVPGLLTQGAVKIATADPTTKNLGKTAMIAGLGGLLSGVFSGASADYQEGVTERFRNTLNNMSAAGTTEVENTEGLHPKIFQHAKDRMALFDIQQKAKTLDLLQKMGFSQWETGMKNAADIEKQLFIGSKTAKSTEERNRFNEALNALKGSKKAVQAESAPDGSEGLMSIQPEEPIVDPLNPSEVVRAKAEAEVREALSKGTLAEEFGTVDREFETALRLIDKDTTWSTLTVLQSFAKILDPTGVVMPGEIKKVQDARPLLESLGLDLKAALTGSGTLTPTAKRRLVEAAGDKYNVFGEKYVAYVKKEQTAGLGRGLREKQMFPAFDYKPFNYSNWAKEGPLKDAPSSAGLSPDMVTKIQQYRSAKAGGAKLTEEQETILQLADQRGL